MKPLRWLRAIPVFTLGQDIRELLPLRSSNNSLLWVAALNGRPMRK